MKTIKIGDKQYIPVVERVKEAHVQDKELTIATEIVRVDGERVSVKATVTVKGKAFTGHSQAVYGVGRFKDVALEIAETSAVGRALGFAGIGIEDGIASADEMRKVKTETTSDNVEDDVY